MAFGDKPGDGRGDAMNQEGKVLSVEEGVACWCRCGWGGTVAGLLEHAALKHGRVPGAVVLE